MNTPAWMEAAVAVLLVLSGGVVLVAALGLHRLGDFFLRLHAPALVSTLAAWAVSLASVLYFSSRGQGLALHVWLVPLVLAVTAPVSAMVLARAALFRRRVAGDPLPPPLSRGG